jgi:hypothetical protein
MGTVWRTSFTVLTIQQDKAHIPMTNSVTILLQNIILVFIDFVDINLYRQNECEGKGSRKNIGIQYVYHK